MTTQKKTVIITGASQGMGAALVQAYRDRNYNVVATSRSIKPGNEIDVATVAGDISNPATAEQVVREGLERFGRIDTLVNNAGVFLAKPFIEMTQEDYDHNLGVNVAGFFNITRLAAAEMFKQGSGHIVSITTSLVDQPITGMPSALASLTKGGLNAVTKSLAIEFAQNGIRVNAVSPGIIKTPMHPEESHEFLSKLHPVGRMGNISDITDAVLYLENANFVTGEILHVDGGQAAGRW